jgi:type III restriction enzyme
MKNELINDVKTIIANDDIKEEIISKQVERSYDIIKRTIDNQSILIPEIIRNISDKPSYKFKDFTLNTDSMNFKPTEEVIIGQELALGGKQIEIFNEEQELYISKEKPVRELIIGIISSKDNIDYQRCSSLINNLINDALNHFKTYMSAEETDKVMRQQARYIAEIIYTQMNDNFVDSENESTIVNVIYSPVVKNRYLTFSSSRGVVDFRTTIPRNDIPKTIFEGFNKSIFPKCKFDSEPELIFVRIMENNNEVIKWLKPNLGDLKITYGFLRKGYIPDFVVETSNEYIIVEIKRHNEIESTETIEKAKAAIEFCKIVNKFAIGKNSLLWRYVLLSENDFNIGMSFGNVVSRGRIV